VPAKATICAQPLRGTLLKAAKPGRFSARKPRQNHGKNGGFPWIPGDFFLGSLWMLNDWKMVGFHSLNVFHGKNHCFMEYDCFYPIKKMGIL
jgi:hypothetical protein